MKDAHQPGSFLPLKFSLPSRNILIGIGLMLCGILGLGWYLFSGQEKPERTSCRVMKVYDGDTIACDLNGNGRIDNKAEHIRLLGIDAPETKHSPKNHTGRDRPYAKKATYWMLDHALHQTVYLEFDERRLDRYGRTLAFVFTSPSEKSSLNEQLLAVGYAKTLFIPPNHKYDERLSQVELEAQTQHRGLWGFYPKEVGNRSDPADGSTETAVDQPH